MKDQYNRPIEYMRISITDRCNMRCMYCMPKGVIKQTHEEILTYEDILQLCKVAVTLGITKYKVTGGEPLVRKGCLDFIRKLKELDGVEQVTLTTNGVLLEEYIEELKACSIDGINISIDSLDEDMYRRVTGCEEGSVKEILEVLKRGCNLGIPMKINSVLLKETKEEIYRLAEIAEKYPVDIRYIELMPIGEGAHLKGLEMEMALKLLKEKYSDLNPTKERRGNGPAHYYTSKQLKGKIGFIDAISHRFCDECNRVRLTSLGILKPCLCYEKGMDFKALLREGAPFEKIKQEMEKCIYRKPRAHSFLDKSQVTEYKSMNEIGG
ncbi:cyclic pyranopterin phosphate synthase [Aequitasia blattaphilus]|uniref:GTP 3',8-cyclase n=1 Tax=Aequitasia blattaphilus TaxID=2949332 RepID=A0ABT1E8F0_9FIRM|nr:GTP 3',8-cyclase MoaA [Aequitasia blattaphilus]MCP1102098.1 GTP 3',8-cyclase MoaA [Aequitasia blattaphilus]MCR8614738.1 GTP 3',8-cyclase MoaA [Aequitasia blattaphilus]